MNKLVLPNEALLEEAARLLDEGRDVSLTPRGSSMHPFIRDGKDEVTLRKASAVTPGDIALVRLKGRYVLHRVIQADDRKVVLMGDGNLSGTETCPPADVLGTVVAINGKAPGRGRFWRFIKPLRRYILAIYRRII